MEANTATTGTEAMTTATPTTRHETLADAFLFSSTAGGVIHSYHGEFYVVGFENMEWAESCGMRVATDFSDLGIPKPYHASPDYA